MLHLVAQSYPLRNRFRLKIDPIDFWELELPYAELYVGPQGRGSYKTDTLFLIHRQSKTTIRPIWPAAVTNLQDYRVSDTTLGLGIWILELPFGEALSFLKKRHFQIKSLKFRLWL